MNPKLVKYLESHFPDFGLDKVEINCSDGWFFLIHFLLKDIKEYIEKENSWRENKDLDIPLIEFKVAQIKEKFSGLRFYYNGGDNKIETKVEFAEHLSYFICEETGVFDESVGGTTKGWLKTISAAQAGQAAWQCRYPEELVEIVKESRNIS